jgi:hypothetical protein
MVAETTGDGRMIETFDVNPDCTRGRKKSVRGRVFHKLGLGVFQKYGWTPSRKKMLAKRESQKKKLAKSPNHHQYLKFGGRKFACCSFLVLCWNPSKAITFVRHL